jgi:hypothetical protein
VSRRDRTVFLALAVLLIVLAALSDAASRGGAQDFRPSTYISSPGGSAALFQLLEELQLEPSRRLTPFVDADPLGGPLALLAPSQTPTPAELHALAEWVRAGGTLFYSARWGDPTLDTLGLQLKQAAPDGSRPGRGDGVPAYPLPHPWTEGTDLVRGFRFAFEPTAGGAGEPLLRNDDGDVVALRLAMGRGQVVAFSDPRPLLNGRIGESGAALVFVRAVAAAGPGVVFDEYHHGFRAGGSAAAATARFLRQSRPGHVLIQLAVAGFLALLVLGARFGAPVPPAPARRRDPLEHVRALAAAYRRARARRTARKLLLNGLLRRLGRPPAETEAAAFESLRRGVSRTAAQAVAELEAEWNKGDRADLATLAGTVDDILTHSRRGR